MLSNLVVLATRFFQLILVFYVVWFLLEPYQKSFCESYLCSKSSFFSKSSLCFDPPSMVTPRPLGTCPKYLQGLNLLMFTKMRFNSNLLMLISSIILMGRQYYNLYAPNHHLLNFLVCSFLSFGNQKTMSLVQKFLVLWFCWVHNVVFHSLLLV
jgi:hypothetical protein